MTLQGMTALVTGATGFVGGALSHRLADEDARVKALARTPEKGDFLHTRQDIEIVPGDITDAERMREVVQGCTHVFHVAAALQGNMAQNRRQQAIDGFRTGRFDILVATDIASRGIDDT